VDRHPAASWPGRARHVDDLAQVPVERQSCRKMCVMEDQAVSHCDDGDSERPRGVHGGTVPIADNQVRCPAPEAFAIPAEPEPKRADHALAGHAGQDGLGARQVVQRVPSLAGAEDLGLVALAQRPNDGASPDGVALASAVYEICDANHCAWSRIRACGGFVTAAGLRSLS